MSTSHHSNQSSQRVLWCAAVLGIPGLPVLFIYSSRPELVAALLPCFALLSYSFARLASIVRGAESSRHNGHGLGAYHQSNEGMAHTSSTEAERPLSHSELVIENGKAQSVTVPRLLDPKPIARGTANTTLGNQPRVKQGTVISGRRAALLSASANG